MDGAAGCSEANQTSAWGVYGSTPNNFLLKQAVDTPLSAHINLRQTLGGAPEVALHSSRLTEVGTFTDALTKQLTVMSFFFFSRLIRSLC